MSAFLQRLYSRIDQIQENQIQALQAENQRLRIEIERLERFAAIAEALFDRVSPDSRNVQMTRDGNAVNGTMPLEDVAASGEVVLAFIQAIEDRRKK